MSPSPRAPEADGGIGTQGAQNQGAERQPRRLQAPAARHHQQEPVDPYGGEDEG